MIIDYLNKLSSKVHILPRVVLASTFIYHGWPKLLDDTGIGIIGYLVGPFEVGGAILLIFGIINDLATRIGSIMLGIIMLGAIYFHLFKWGDGLGDIEWQILILAISILYACKGNSLNEGNKFKNKNE